MKIKHLLLGLFAVAAAVACEPEVQVTPVLNVDKESVALEATAAEATFAVTSNQSWTATADQDWVTLEPASGEASDKAVTVKVTAEDNPAEEARTATVTVTAGELTKTVAVSQAAAEGGEEPGPGTEPEPTEYTLDGKQWLADVEGLETLFDFGYTDEEMLSVARPSMDGSAYMLYMTGAYEVAPAEDGVSGVITFTQYDWEWEEFLDPVEFSYSGLTETSVNLVCESVFGVADPVALTLVTEPVEIEIEGGNGGEDPVGPIENGEYWFFNGDKVMAPLAEGVTSGPLPASDAVNGASTVKNIFTLTYDPDMSYYTIQDSYGRYLGHEDFESGDFTTTTVLPSGDEYAYYLWCVDNSYEDGTCDVYNAATYYGFAYSADNDNWYADGYSYETDGVRPTLVLAENPVEEPEPEVPAGPKVVTVAEFLEAAEDDTEYQLTGVMEGTYNTTYGNFYINDGTAKVLVYGLTATKVTSNDKSFATLGLRDGDTVTLVGKRSSYNDTPQVGGPAYYVSHVAAPYVDFEAAASVLDTETTYTLEVDSNTDWTATSSAGVTLNQTSGNGNADVVLTFAANTASEAVTHTVTFAYGDKTKVFTLTQKAVPAADETVVFEETFAEFDGTMGWEGSSAQGNTTTPDNEGWTMANVSGAGGAAKFGTSSKLGSAETPALNFTGTATLTFKAGAWNNGSESTTLKLSMTNGTLSVDTVTLKKGEWSEYEVTITNAVEGAKIKFEGMQASKSRFFLDDVKIVQAQ